MCPNEMELISEFDFVQRAIDLIGLNLDIVIISNFNLSILLQFVGFTFLAVSYTGANELFDCDKFNCKSIFVRIITIVLINLIHLKVILQVVEKQQRIFREMLTMYRVSNVSITSEFARKSIVKYKRHIVSSILNNITRYQ